MISLRVFAALAGIVFIFVGRGAAFADDDVWEPYQYLVGDWAGERGWRGDITISAGYDQGGDREGTDNHRDALGRPWGLGIPPAGP
jgi:hypothetical protein